MTSFSSSKILAGVGSIIYGSIIGIILVLVGMKGLSEYYKDSRIYNGLVIGIILLIIGTVLPIAGGVILLFGIVGGIGFIGSSYNGYYSGYGGFDGDLGIGAVGASLILLVVGVVICFIIAFILDLLAVRYIKNCFHVLAERSGKNLFHTAGTLMWVGAILTIVGVGFFLIWIGFIIAAVGFFTLDEKQDITGNTTSSPAYGYTAQQPTTATADSSSVKANFCMSCGASVTPNATFCINCGKQV